MNGGLMVIQHCLETGITDPIEKLFLPRETENLGSALGFWEVFVFMGHKSSTQSVDVLEARR
jgi:hypothetical protein